VKREVICALLDYEVVEFQSNCFQRELLKNGTINRQKNRKNMPR
jgi:hypothetical protein